MATFGFIALQSSTLPDKNAIGTGFPAPYADTTLEATAFETAVPLGELIDWYWNHNELQVDADFAFSAGAESRQFVLATATPTGIASPGWDTLILGVPKTYTFTDSAGNISNTIFAAGAEGSPFYHPTVGKDGTDFFPALAISGTLSCVDGADSISVEFNSNSANMVGPITGTIPMNILGYAFTLYFSATAAGDGFFSGSFYNVSLVSTFPY